MRLILDRETIARCVPEVTRFCDDFPQAAIVAEGSGARGALWWDHMPEWAGKRLGAIGALAGENASERLQLLQACADQLRKIGCEYAIGPMNGSTWRSHRLIVEGDSEAPFFLEPPRDDSWISSWQDGGFEVVSRYFSALNTDLAVRDPRVLAAEERFLSEKLTIREIHVDSFESELERLHVLCMEAFKTNVLFRPLSWNDFLALYLPLREHIDPRLVLLAEDGGEPVGFAFGIPDWCSPQAAHSTCILKSVAVKPGRRYAGLGNVLVDAVQQRARGAGFQRVIHALMHESNNSLNLSARYAVPFRRYVLFGKQL